MHHWHGVGRASSAFRHYLKRPVINSRAFLSFFQGLLRDGRRGAQVFQSLSIGKYALYSDLEEVKMFEARARLNWE